MNVILVSVILSAALTFLQTTVGERGMPTNLCGQMCLYAALHRIGVAATFEQVCAALPADGSEKTLLEIENAARRLRLETAAVAWSDNNLGTFRAPAITPVLLPGTPPQRHYVLVLHSRPGWFYIYDPPNGYGWSPIDRFRSIWAGNALHVGKDARLLPAVRSPVGLDRVVWWGGVVLAALSIAIALPVTYERSARSAATIIAVVAAIFTSYYTIAWLLEWTQRAPIEAIRFEIAEIEIALEFPDKSNAPIAATPVKLLNGSSSNLRVRRLSSNCVCVVAEMSQRVVTAGSFANVLLTPFASAKSDQTAEIVVEFEEPSIGPRSLKVKIRKDDKR